MSKIWLLFLLFCAHVYGEAYTHTFKLKKDEIARVHVKKMDHATSVKAGGELFFRWTLYHGNQLVFLVNYEGFPTQHVLKKTFKRDTVRVDLVGDYTRVDEKIFALLKFTAYDTKNKTATIDVMITDPKQRVEVKFTNPMKK